MEGSRDRLPDFNERSEVKGSRGVGGEWGVAGDLQATQIVYRGPRGVGPGRAGQGYGRLLPGSAHAELASHRGQ